MREHSMALAMLMVPCTAAIAQPVTFSLDPRGTFLRANLDTVTAPAIRSLASLNVAPGDLIQIRILNRYGYDISGNEAAGSVAVFSSSATLLASNVQFRVPGAIDAGLDAPTGLTYRGGLPTDIPEDFSTGNIAGSLDARVVVPAGAAYLFIGVADSLYEDNTDTNHDFGAEVSVVCPGNRCCGSSDFNGDGDFGTDQDIEAFFACLGGTCCPTCLSGGSDFNGDGDFGTDQDIEAFFRVLAGGNC